MTGVDEKGVFKLPEHRPFNPRDLKGASRRKLIDAYKGEHAEITRVADRLAAAFAAHRLLKKISVTVLPFDERRMDSLTVQNPWFQFNIRDRYNGEPYSHISEVAAGNQAMIVSDFLNHHLTGRMPIQVYKKLWQSGKSRDQYNACVLVPALAGLHGIKVRPFVLLPGERDITAQVSKEYGTAFAPFHLMQFAYKGEQVDMDWNINLLMQNEFGTLFIPRTKSRRNFEQVEQNIRESIADRSIPYILVDEGDKGVGVRSVLEQMLSFEASPSGQTAIQMIASADPRIALVPFTATPGLYGYQANAEVLIRELQHEKSYVAWTALPRFNMYSFGKKIGVPELGLMPQSADGKTSPLSYDELAKSAFVRDFLLPTKDGLQMREPQEKPHKWAKHALKAALANHDDEIEDLMEEYRNDLPKIITKAMLGMTVNPDTRLPGIKVCTMRVVLDNLLTQELRDNIERSSEDEFIVATLLGDSRSDEAMNFEKRIEEEYRARNVALYSVPILVLHTASGRRGSRFPDNLIKISCTRGSGSSNWATVSQDHGRPGGYKKNSMNVMTDSMLGLIEGHLSGRRPLKEHQHLRREVGRPRTHQLTTAHIHRDTLESNCNSKNAFILSLFDEVDRRILAHPSFVKQVTEQYKLGFGKKADGRESMTLRGGKLIPKSFPGMPSLFDIITQDILSKIEANHQHIFTVNNEPEYVEMKFLKFDPSKSSDDQPKGLENKDGIVERYHADPIVDRITGRKRMFYYHGFRFEPTNINTGARKLSYKQQPQIGFTYERQGGRLVMRCTQIDLRLCTPALPSSTGYRPAPDTFPDRLDKLYEEMEDAA